MRRDLSFQLIMAAAMLAVWIAIGTSGFMLVEGWTFVDSLYMTVITISTVGFREVHQLSPAGKLFAILVPDASAKIAAGDTLVVMGEEDDLKKIEAACLART